MLILGCQEEARSQSIVGTWQRIGDYSAGTIVRVEQGTNQGELLEVKGGLIKLGFKRGQIKWKGIHNIGGNSWEGMDLYCRPGEGCKYLGAEFTFYDNGKYLRIKWFGTPRNTVGGTTQKWVQIQPVLSGGGGGQPESDSHASSQRAVDAGPIPRPSTHGSFAGPSSSYDEPQAGPPTNGSDGDRDGLSQDTFSGDNVISTKTIEGKYLRTEVGDYHHAIFLINNSRELSLWCSEKLSRLLEKHRGKQMKILYQIVERYIPETSGKDRMEVVKEVKMDGVALKE